MDENLKQLEDIGKEIDNIENKLQSISVEDSNIYNRKQRRQIQRRMVRDEKLKQSKAEQKEILLLLEKNLLDCSNQFKDCATDYFMLTFLLPL